MEVKTNKEYQAMQNEISAAEQEISDARRRGCSSAWKKPTRSPPS